MRSHTGYIVKMTCKKAFLFFNQIYRIYMCVSLDDFEVFLGLIDIVLLYYNLY